MYDACSPVPTISLHDMNSITLSILVPVYNESRTIVTIMNALREHCSDAQHIYIDDGSTDDSLAIIRAHARAEDSVITQKNGGKGSAIIAGLKQATGQYTIIQDADLEYHPTQISTLLQVAISHPQCAVFGSRFLQWNPSTHWRFRLGNQLLTKLSNLLFGAHITDSYTCYKLLPTDLLRSFALVSRGFELEAEITGKCLRRSIAIKEVPIEYSPRSVDEGKKIRWQDAWKGMVVLCRERLMSAPTVSAE